MVEIQESTKNMLNLKQPKMIKIKELMKYLKFKK